MKFLKKLRIEKSTQAFFLLHPILLGGYAICHILIYVTPWAIHYENYVMLFQDHDYTGRLSAGFV